MHNNKILYSKFEELKQIEHFLVICISTHHIPKAYTYTGSRNFLQRFIRGVALKSCSLLFLIQDKNSMLKKDQIPRKTIKIKIYCNMHIFTLCPKYLLSFTKLRSRIYVQRYKRSCAYKLFITCTLFNIWPTFYVQKVDIPTTKNNGIGISRYMNIYTLCSKYNVPTKFQQTLCSSVRGVAF